MGLKSQIYSLFFSFVFGIFFYLFLELCGNYLYSKKIVVRYIFSLLFSLFFSLLYFMILLRINNGILHMYFFLTILLGYVISKYIYRLFVKKDWLCYNYIRK